MRLARLDLLAFGPFTSRSLDLAGGRSALHLLYGPNEAGKSTALRAITALLYGIPERTVDAHRHAAADLRVGGALSAEPGGAVVEVVRRKGRKNTLLSPAGAPVDEAVVARLLGGVDEDAFGAMFGLDHVTLRQGAQALLDAGGRAGEALLGAALGGGALTRLLREIETEAEELYTERAQKKPLNDALKTLREALAQGRLPPTTVEIWEGQKRAAEEARHDVARLDDEIRSLRARHHRRERARRVLPLLARLGAAREQRAALGEVRAIDEGAVRARVDAERAAAETRAAIATLEAEIAALDERRAGLEAPDGLAAATEPLALAALLPERRQAAEREQKARSELAELERDLVRLAAAVGPAPLGLPDAGPGADERALAALRDRPPARGPLSLVVRAARAARQRADELARERALAEQAARRAAAVRARLDEHEPAPGLDALTAALELAERAGDLDEAKRRAGARVDELDRAVATDRAALGWTTAAGAEGLAGPAAIQGRLADPAAIQGRLADPAAIVADETIDDFEERLARQARQRERVAERRRELERRAADASRELDALTRAQAVATEADLVAVRARRDATWSALAATLRARTDEPASAVAGDNPARATRGRRTATAAPADPSELAARFEREGAEADALADRLRREADRVAAAARLGAERDAAARELEAVAEQTAALELAAQELAAEWASVWTGAGVEPRTPREMRPWLERRRALERRVGELDEARREARAVDERRAQIAADLRAALGEPREPALASGSSLSTLVAEARARVERGRAALARRDEIARTLAAIDEERDAHDASAERLEAERTRADAALAGALEAARLSATLAPDVAESVAEPLAEVAPKLASAAALADEIARLADARAAFAARVGEAVRAWAAGEPPRGLGRLEPLDAAAELVARHEKARELAARAEKLELERADRSNRLASEHRRLETATRTLAELIGAAGVADVAALGRAEQRSAEARRLAGEIDKLEQSLLAAGEGAALADLVEQTQGLDPDELAAEIDELEASIEERETERGQAYKRIGSTEAGLRELVDKSTAADAALAVEQARARVQRLAERWARLRVGAAVLTREIERYRQKHQAPLLARASGLFALLSAGSFKALHVGWGDDDEPVLRCVRPDDREVGVEGLSDGARDQLFLALRIASTELHGKSGGDMPLVLDDVLIHFDAERAEGALRALGELAASTQILFFTHHAHLVDVARRAVDPALLVVHEL